MAGRGHRAGMRRSASEVPAVASRQRGVFTSAQARDEGWANHQVSHRLRHGHWRRLVGRGLTSRDVPDGDRARANLLAWATRLTWPDAVVCRDVAGLLHGFPLPVPTSVHVYAPRGRPSTRGIHPHERHLSPAERMARGGLTLTSPVRTAIDCLATLDWPQALDLYAWLTTRCVMDRSQLLDAVRTGTGRSGTPQLLRLVRVTRSGAVSSAENTFHGLLRRAGLAGWTAGARVGDERGLIGVVDVLFRDALIVIEIDGLRAHTDPEVFRRDRRRQNRLVAAGYLVLRFTWWDLVDRPDEVIAEVTGALVARGRRP